VIGWDANKWAEEFLAARGAPTSNDHVPPRPIAPAPAPTPATSTANSAPVAAPESSSPPVSAKVERAAKALALQVSDGGAQPRDRLFDPALNEDTANELLGHAVAQQWVTVDGDRIAPGPVNPRPAEDIASTESARAWRSMLG
jgi:hypothetical protein